jgi:hypothetical protein
MDTLAASLGLDILRAKCKRVNEGADSCLQDCHAKQGQSLLQSGLFSCKVLRAMEAYLAYAARTPVCGLPSALSTHICNARVCMLQKSELLLLLLLLLLLRCVTPVVQAGCTFRQVEGSAPHCRCGPKVLYKMWQLHNDILRMQQWQSAALVITKRRAVLQHCRC